MVEGCGCGVQGIGALGFHILHLQVASNVSYTFYEALKEEQDRSLGIPQGTAQLYPKGLRCSLNQTDRQFSS